MDELRYLMIMLYFVRDQYILAENDVMAYVIAALGSTEFVDCPPTANNLILYDQFFNEHKTVLI
jgi:hypothetical protein